MYFGELNLLPFLCAPWVCAFCVAASLFGKDHTVPLIKIFILASAASPLKFPVATMPSPIVKYVSQDKISRIRKRKRGRNMLNRSGNTTDNLCFRYRFRDVFSRFRCCVYNGTGPLFVHVKHNGNMELHVSTTFQKYGNMWFRPVFGYAVSLVSPVSCVTDL